MSDLRGRTAVVTGAARGIGRAYAERLARDGADVAIVDLDAGDLVLDELSGAGRKRFLACDVSEPEQVTAVREAVLDTFGCCDILVNNAAYFPATSLETVTLEVWRRVQAVNVESILLFVQAFAPGMRAAGWGRIVNTGSGNTLSQVKDLAYMTSKGAVHVLTRALANELGDDGITVNAIAPSAVATPGLASRPRLAGRPSADDVLVGAVAAQTIKRPSVPADLANVLSFLVSEDADFMTGQILHADGGLSRSGA